MAFAPPLPNGFGPTFLRLSPKLEPWKVLSADAPPTGADFPKFYGANEA